MWYFILGSLIGYWLGWADAKWGEPPPPLKGTYDSGEHEDRVEDYGDWD